MLKYYGYPNVFILDGGLPKWISEQQPTESGEYQTHVVESPDLSLYHFSENREMRILINHVEEIVNRRKAGDETVQIWDPRPQNIYQNGHVPTAVNLPAGQFLFSDDKTIKSADEVRQILQAQNIKTEGEIVTSCMKGNSASLGYVIQRYIGNDHAKVYTGSFEEWKKLKDN